MQHAPRHPAAVEAWAVAHSPSAWRLPPHPRFVGKLPPSLDWAAARAAADLSGLPWSAVRDLLIEIEAGAQLGFAEPGVLIEDIADDG